VKPEIGHLRIFGCPIFIHVLVEKRKKMDPLGHKGIFVGYNETSKDYRIFIPSQWNKIVIIYVNLKERLESSRYQESSAVTKDEEKHDSKD
jgi:hypothetical protein